MLAYRLLRVVLHLFAGLFTCVLVFPWLDVRGREACIRRWSARLLSICGVKIHVVGAAGAPHALVVANHVSWLDIFVINSLHPCRFVAKSEIRSWPLIGRLCAMTGTIFIARGRVREVRRIYEGLVHALQAGERVAFFPEGTTAVQGNLLPFHANLFEAAIEARVPVQPYVLRYVDAQGCFHPAAEFVGDTTFAQSMLSILRARNMTAQLQALPSIEANASSHRRELAAAAQNSIAEALAVKSHPASDIADKRPG